MSKKKLLQVEVVNEHEALSAAAVDPLFRKEFEAGKQLSIGTPEETEYGTYIATVYVTDATLDLAENHITIAGDASEVGKRIAERLESLAKVDLPTEDEVYEEALKSRAYNTSMKVQRLTEEVRKEVGELSKKSDELMRAQMELNVLNEELEDKEVDYYSQAVRNGALKYVGTDLLKAYAQLKAVFDIDGERPDPKVAETAYELGKFIDGEMERKTNLD